MTPKAAATRCTKQCGRKATKEGRCEQHQRQAWENQSTNTRTLTSAIRAKFRREQLAREPHCRTCGTTTKLEADHIIEIEDGGDPLDPSNGQTLCEPHHREKTLLARRLRAARRRQQ